MSGASSAAVDYALLTEQLEALAKGVGERVTNLANAAALLWQTLPALNWAGFYLARPQGLILGPFMGKPACTAIPYGKGVCGAAAATGAVQRVPDVHLFPGHIACDAASRSELVIPLYVGGALFGVMDLDSPELSRFSEADEAGLIRFARVLERALAACAPGTV